jgi:hypothetical protein
LTIHVDFAGATTSTKTTGWNVNSCSLSRLKPVITFGTITLASIGPLDCDGRALVPHGGVNGKTTPLADAATTGLVVKQA